MPVPVLHRKNIEMLAPHGDCLPLLGFPLPLLPSEVLVFISWHHLLLEAQVHLCTNEPVPQVRRADSRL